MDFGSGNWLPVRSGKVFLVMSDSTVSGMYGQAKHSGLASFSMHVQIQSYCGLHCALQKSTLIKIK